MGYKTLLIHGLQWIVAISLGGVLAISVAAEQGQSVKGSQPGKPVARIPAIIYKPPLEDIPVRVDRSSRGTGVEAVILQVLAPDHAGLTTQERPILYWYARTPVAENFEFTLVEEGGVEPLLEVGVSLEEVDGIQRLKLDDHNISLQPGVTYQWSVSLMMDENSRSAAVIANGVVVRMEPGEGLTSRIEKSHGIDLVNVYASEGIWYDALDTISSMIDKTPEEPALVAIRASLLEQVGLHAEKKGAGPGI